MADLYLTPAERYTAALGGFYYGDLPEPGTVYTQLIKDILDGSTPDKEPKNILARFIYSLYISDLEDPYPRYELAKLLYWKLHDITPTKAGSVLTVTIDGEEDYMTINTDLSRLWYKVLFGSKTDIITEFPYIFNTMQNKLSDWELFGNTVQSGTPTPDSPVMPDGTGERTGNLFDKNSAPSVGWYCGSDDIIRSSTAIKATYIPCSPNTTYTIAKVQSARFKVAWTANEPALGVTYYGLINVSGTSVTVTTGSTAAYLYVEYYTSASDTYTEAEIRNTIMLNTGSTALPYEPYGYKIGILSAGQTNNIYLGEVETTRKIKKLVLTGEENWIKSSAYQGSFYVPIIAGVISETYTAYCSHLVFSALSRYAKGKFCFNGGTVKNCNLWFNQFDSNTTVEELKSYLAAQYAAGTPVTVWYVLAESETGIVNEPLMNIGEYADSMSRAQTGIDIPTVIGQNTLDVLTTVKPSSMSIEYTSADENRSRSKRISLLKSPLKKGLIK